MKRAVTRRSAMTRLGAAGAGLLASRSVLWKQEPPVVGGREVAISVRSLGSSTVRITVSPFEDGRARPVPDDGAIVTGASSIASSAAGLRVRFSGNPPSFQVETESGRLVQRLSLDAASHDVTFLLPEGPLLGMGQGGPQFDRKGSVDAMRNGHGGYQLRTHGGRVPIQWLVGTDGWGLFIHQPLGTFDFTGKEGRFRVEP